MPFAFTGKIDKLTIAVEPPVLTEEDMKKLLEAEHAAQDAELISSPESGGNQCCGGAIAPPPLS